MAWPQYGALGAARQGLTYAQIVDFYYPGTTRGDKGNPTVRVQLTGFSGSSVQVGPDPGGALTVTDSGNPTATATETDGRFRVVINAGALRVQRGDNSGANWQDYPLGTPTTAGQVVFSAPNGVWVYAADGSARKYFGTIRVLGSSPTVVQAVNDVDMQHYLYASVPYEVSASWPVEAVKAQSVAARSYALSVKGSNANWDLCDTDACQMYVGTQWKTAAGAVTTKEFVASNAAIDATAGVTLLESGGGAAFAQYASSNGGWSTRGSKPYLVGQADPYSTKTDDPHRDWTFQLTASWLKATYPEVGDIVGLRVVSRDGYGDWGGRVTAAEVVGTAGTKRVTNPRFGMKSNYWTAGDADRHAHHLEVGPLDRQPRQRQGGPRGRSRSPAGRSTRPRWTGSATSTSLSTARLRHGSSPTPPVRTLGRPTRRLAPSTVTPPRWTCPAAAPTRSARTGSTA